MIGTIPAGSSFSVRLNGGINASGKTIVRTQTFSTNIRGNLANEHAAEVYALCVAMAPLLAMPVLGVYCRDNWQIEDE